MEGVRVKGGKQWSFKQADKTQVSQLRIFRFSFVLAFNIYQANSIAVKSEKIERAGLAKIGQTGIKIGYFWFSLGPVMAQRVGQTRDMLCSSQVANWISELFSFV